ncbi:inositol 1,4,5-trisphosphate receptor-interacting protein isoform X1 [Equus przewalskii]|uniref:Inositol 1,4,5-trisphosphate receptor-interacting protein n=2 Tax=Equus przewalskii TaxID=9798 RepID=A0ABM2EM67_EQUPR|nr:PREDICTED: inositol 1,4,5-trisphosphate receptor-interacting protein isoform X2 [Equus przewalskii]XP_008516566.1 PREDICTED: inositol 1,4,5-trisphosphate receptor-interacting protein isoform X2 [Equus przewalskii]XP_008516567.1 PREDICTED: inositol 1,4,5-trisphosphate receptor-interacting protein isoform X2 [Equus przewalskii]XP_008516568.1 PREDICTED: inositol 1,4,5-trisphosphate receptor-interacting protein isoform X2 [Equus przewalskii]XP_008516569.1 PREDICTED: inositol 1,4,5-trisphosphate 
MNTCSLAPLGKAPAMALGLFRVCLVVVTAIINHPLLFPRENATVPENEEEIIRKMQAHQEKLQLEQLRLEEEVARLAAEKEALEPVAEEGQQQNESRVAWDLWSTLCMILFLVIEVWRQDHQDGPSPECLGGDEDELPGLQGAPLRGLTLPNKATLDHFYERCIRGATADAARTREFVEGFVDDLLEALRSLCNRDTDMEVEDFIGVDSMYENWQVDKPLLCNLFVPFMPPEPFHFHPELWCSSRSVPLDRQGYGQIKVVRADEDTRGCICGKTKLGEDMLCLLHGKNNLLQPGREVKDPLCARDSPYLDTMQVMKWFQMALTRAWHRIAHKYEFDLAFGQLETPGSLKIKFRSGKFMPFNLIPVIQCDDSDLYFVSYLAREPSGGTPASSTDWLLSFAVYERHFLRMTSKALPEGACHLSCLQIASFLLSKQSRLTGPSGLGNYHLKTALLHLLLARRAADWKAGQLDARLQELLCFVEKSLLEKKLHHFFIGNRKVPEAMGLPEAVGRAEPLNLFRPFVLQRRLYRKTVDSFYEMLKNAPALINEYSVHIPSDHASLPQKAVIL